jgi:hypothetical protein
LLNEERQYGNEKKNDVPNDQNILVGIPAVEHIFRGEKKAIENNKQQNHGQQNLKPVFIHSCFFLDVSFISL